MHNKLYTIIHVEDIYRRAVEEWQQYCQWKRMDVPHRAVEYFSKCAALVELMESIYCFDVGLGAFGKSRHLQDRLHSFKDIK